MLYDDVVDEFYLGNKELAAAEVEALLKDNFLFSELAPFSLSDNPRSSGEVVLEVSQSLKKKVSVPFYLRNKLCFFLKDLSVGQLRLLATEELGIPIKYNHEDYLLSVIRKFLTNQDTLSVYHSALSDSVKSIFDYVLNLGGLVQVGSLLKEFPYSSQIITKMLRKTPLLFLENSGTAKEYEEKWAVIPIDLLSYFKGQEWNTFNCNVDVWDSVGIIEKECHFEKNLLSKAHMLLFDLASFLSFFSGVKVRLFKGDRLGRKTIEDLKKAAFEECEAEYINFLFDFALSKKLICSENASVTVNTARVIKLFKDAEVLTGELYRFWLDEHSISLYLIEMLMSIDKKSVFSYLGVRDFLSNYPDRALKCMSEESLQELFRGFVRLGFLTCAGEEGLYSLVGVVPFFEELLAGKSLTYTELSTVSTEEIYSDEDSVLIVQPNSEIVLPLSFPLYKALFLSQFAKRVLCQKVMKFELTKESLVRGFDIGLQTEAILDFLGTNSAKEIPQNIYHLIMDCGRKYGEIEIIPGGDLLKVEDPLIIKEISLQKELTPFFEGSVGEYILILTEGCDIDKLNSVLKSKGYFPKVDKKLLAQREPTRNTVKKFQKLCSLLKKYEKEIKPILDKTDLKDFLALLGD